MELESAEVAKESRERLSAAAPMDFLLDKVMSLTGPAALWHRRDLYHHELRYRADCALVNRLLPAGSTLLEIGAAPCHLTALLTASGYSVTGVDLAP
jgi:hypothetical protein